jgi:hypothetical protein
MLVTFSVLPESELVATELKLVISIEHQPSQLPSFCHQTMQSILWQSICEEPLLLHLLQQ